MPETISLNKANPLLPAEDYNALRKQGFKAMEKLGSANWTNYNNSDPGITILEAVCYAITDLAYRTGFDIKDILAPEELNEDTWKQIFYTARQILHNSPLTLNDYRKLLIDVKGVRNAWIELSKDYEAPIWVDYNALLLRKDDDCGCDDSGERVCRGQLGLDPVSPEQAKQEYQAALEKIKSRLEALSKRQTDLTDKIDGLKKQLENADPASKPIIEAQIAELEQQVKALQAEIDALQAIYSRYDQPDFSPLPSKIVELEGLYNIMIEYEEDVLDEHRRETVRQTVIERLFAHRNLCEDFLSVSAVEYDDFGIGASIELEEYADPDMVLAQIFFTIYLYFTPSIPFNTIAQMLADGYWVDEIFEGPALKHGFIKDADLEKTDLFRDIRMSDIINLVADIKGIKGILYLHLPFTGFDQPEAGKNYFNLWIDALRSARKIARIRPEKSQILFCKNRDFISYFTGNPGDRGPDRMLKLFNDLKSRERKYKLENPQTDFPVPVGEHMRIEDYFPVTESLPMCYNVGKRVGMPGEGEAKLRAQALQLKGYLLFFEQMLAGYLQQLSHMRDLFSFDDQQRHTYFAYDNREEYHPQCPDDSSGDVTKHYYVSEWLDEIDQLRALLIDHENFAEQGKCDADTFAHIRNTFIHTVQNLLETPELFGARRNRFLDHMLARFCEDLAEYEGISRWLEADGADKRLIATKINMLKDGEYFRISSNRGRAYNYGVPSFWDTPNVSGTERRVSRLLGFPSIQRRTLAPDFVVSETLYETDPKTKQQVPKKNARGQLLNVVKFYDPDDKETVLLTSVEVADGCCTEELMTAILTHADDRHNFRLREDLKQRSRKSAGLIGTFWCELWEGSDPDTAILLGSGERYDKKEARDKAFRKLLGLMEAIDRNEGLHLVEHLLLRPRLDVEFDEAEQRINPVFLEVCLDDCDLGIGLGEGTEVPPYRKKIRRIPAEICYDKLPWVLEYYRYNQNTKKFDQSILFQQVPVDGSAPERLKFRRYEDLAQRVRDLQEFGSELVNYEIVSNQQSDPANLKYGFIIHADGGRVLAQSLYVFNRRKPGQNKPVKDDIDLEIQQWMKYFEFEFDLYCEADPCDNDEDPYSFRVTAVLPCWPKRLRDPTFRNLVEKTLQSETPAHVYPRIVWLGIQEMRRFETAYYAWLEEMSRTELPDYEKTNPLVEVLNTLRPCGVCSDDCAPDR